MPPRPPSDVFRPRLPLDPFADHSQPWAIHHTLPHSQPHLILVLGAPSSTDLAPLTASPFLSNSLLILATHTPPPISITPSTTPGPTIIILHLPAPLAVHDVGALRLVSLLERAQRVAHTWYPMRHSHTRIQQLAEEFPGGEFTRLEDVELAPVAPQLATLPRKRLSPLNPSAAVDTDTDDVLSLSSTLSNLSTASAASRVASSPRVKFKHHASKPPQKGQVLPFTALVNFLPPTLPDKALLKHAVLVTTLSAPFLSATVPALPTSPYNAAITERRRSIFSTHSSQSLPIQDLSTSKTSVMSALNLTIPLPGSRRRSRISFLFSSAQPSLESLSTQAHSQKGRAAESAKNLHSKAHIVHVLPYSAFFSSSSPSGSSSSLPPGAHSSSMQASTSTLQPPSPPHKQKRLTARGMSDPGTLGRVSFASNIPNINGIASVYSSQSQSNLRPGQANSIPSLVGSGSGVHYALPVPQLQGTLRPRARKTKLVQSIEQFLLSHAYPLNMPSNPSPNPNSSSLAALSSPSSSSSSSSRSSPISRPTSIYSTYSMSTLASSVPGLGQDIQGQGAVVPFLLPAGVLGCVPLPHEKGGGGMSIGEMVMLGVLDDVAGGGNGLGWPRAWIGDGGDVVFAPVPVNQNAEETEAQRGREEMSMQRLHIPTHVERNQSQSKGKGKARNLNEAGLPTPPESSSSLDGEASEEGSVPPSPVSSHSEEDGMWVKIKEGEVETERWAKEGGRRRGRGIMSPVRGVDKNPRALRNRGGGKDGKGGMKNRVSSFFKFGLPLKAKERGRVH